MFRADGKHHDKIQKNVTRTGRSVVRREVDEEVYPGLLDCMRRRALSHEWLVGLQAALNVRRWKGSAWSRARLCFDALRGGCRVSGKTKARGGGEEIRVGYLWDPCSNTSRTFVLALSLAPQTMSGQCWAHADIGATLYGPGRSRGACAIWTGGGVSILHDFCRLNKWRSNARQIIPTFAI